MIIPWLAITGIGRFTVLTPVAVVLAVWFGMARDWRHLLLWLGLYVGGMAVVVMTKIAFIGWGLGIEAWDYTGMSGHAMRAASVLPALFWLLAAQRGQAARALAIVAGVLCAGVICWSRIVVHAHSLAEVVLGGGFGLALFAVLHRSLSAPNARPPVTYRWMLLVGAFSMLGTPAIQPLPTQQWITRAALLVSGHTHPYTRQGWHRHHMPVQPAASD